MSPSSTNQRACSAGLFTPFFWSQPVRVRARDRVRVRVRVRVVLPSGASLCRKQARSGRPASAAEAADCPRMAGAWGSLRRDLALQAASGASAGRRPSHLASDMAVSLRGGAPLCQTQAGPKSASGRSGGLLQRQISPEAAPRSGHPRPVFDMAASLRGGAAAIRFRRPAAAGRRPPSARPPPPPRRRAR